VTELNQVLKRDETAQHVWINRVSERFLNGTSAHKRLFRTISCEIPSLHNNLQQIY